MQLDLSLGLAAKVVVVANGDLTVSHWWLNSDPVWSRVQRLLVSKFTFELDVVGHLMVQSEGLATVRTRQVFPTAPSVD